MRRSYLFVILSFACFAPPLNAADVFRGETGVCVRSGEQINPAILVTDNPIVVWQDNRNGNWDIYAYDFARQQEYPVCIAAGDQTNPRMGWGPANLIIVWQDNRNGNWDIYALTVPAFYDHTMDWLNAVELPVCARNGSQCNPDVGNSIFWQDDRNGNWDIYSYDLENPDTNSVPLVTAAGDQINVSAGRFISPEGPPVTVAWQDNRNGTWDIYSCSAANEEPICTNTGDQILPSVSGNAMVWEDGRRGTQDIYFNAPGWPAAALVADSNQHGRPIMFTGTSRAAIAWQQDEGNLSHLYIGWWAPDYSFIKERALAIDSNQINARGDYSWVVWQDDRNGSWDIYAAKVCLNKNDNCDDCIATVEEGVPYFGSTVGMTGIQACIIPQTGSAIWYEYYSECGFNDTNDVWHIYEPTAGGTVTVSTEGSDFDTTLAVYNGRLTSTEERLLPDTLACNDDYSLNNTQSKVTLSVVKGKKYYIRVAGYDGATGNYALLITRGTCAGIIRSDLDDNCSVDFRDFALFTAQWLASNVQP